MSTVGKLRLQWNDFQSTLSSSFRHLTEFHDVTLVSAELKTFTAHKLVLAACSPFFHSVLAANPHPNPLLYLRGVSSTHLAAVLAFCYEGECLNLFSSQCGSSKNKILTFSAQVRYE